MPNTPWKSSEVPPSMKPDELGNALSTSYPSALLSASWRSALRQADYMASCRRMIASQHTGGSGAWLVGNVDPDAGTQQYPEPDTARTVAARTWVLAPGNQPGVRVVAVRSGMSETYHPFTAEWLPYGAQARIEVAFAFDNGTDTSSSKVSIPLDPSLEADGYEPTSAGGSWDSLVFGYGIVPADAAAVQQRSEDTSVTATVSHFGGTRVVHCSIWEWPKTHNVPHDREDVSLHGWSPATQPADARPQTEMRDGAVYEEHRFGTYRALRTAERQNRRLGPAIAAWTSYAEGLADFDGQNPANVTSTNWVGVSIGASINEWDADLPGHDIAGHYAACAPENLPTRVDGVVLVPVRIRVTARFGAAGGDFGYMKFQSSPRSWVIIAIPQIEEFTERTTTGWLEATAAPGDLVPVIADFAKVENGTMQILDWSIDWGEFPVAG